jgi:hypothetical protein
LIHINRAGAPISQVQQITNQQLTYLWVDCEGWHHHIQLDLALPTIFYVHIFL